MKTKLLPLAILFPVLMNAQGTWTQKASLGGVTRYNPVSFTIGTKAYVGTGAAWATGPCYDDFWEWDQGTNVWTQKANYGGGVIGGAVGFAINEYGYVGTGSPNNLHPTGAVSNQFWEYNPNANTWTQKANFGGTARVFAVGFAIGRFGYIATGYDGLTSNGGTKDMWEYDQQSDTWTKKADFGGSARFLASGFVIGTKAYMGTGYGYSVGYQKDLWEWDQATNTWAQKADHPINGVSECVAFSIGDYGYMGTGTTSTGINALMSFYRYIPATDSWSQMANFGGGLREQATGFAIGCKGYVCAGWYNDSPSNLKKDLWEYAPDTCAGVGIAENNISYAICIYPNPTSGKFVVGTEFTKGEVVIYSVTGMKVLSGTLSQSKTRVDLSAHPNGVYFLQLITEKGIARKKIILSR